MVDVIAIGLIVLGAVLLLSGAALSVYGVALLGVLIGGGTGYMMAPTIAGVLGAEGTLLATAVPVLVGAIGGAALAYTLLSVMIAAAGFVAGGLLGQFVIVGGGFVEGAFYVEWGAIVLAAMGGALFGFVFSKTALVFITAFLGAAFASTQLAVSNFSEAGDQLSIDPLLIEADPIFLGLFALGVLSQFGLFKLGYVTKITAVLPGAKAIRNRGDSDGVGGAEGA